MAAGWRFLSMAGEVGKAYDAALSEAGAVDFTDLIRLPVTLLTGAPDVLESVRADVRHLLVDEFQDVDAAQAELTGLLALGADSFCAVGTRTSRSTGGGEPPPPPCSPSSATTRARR